MMNLLLHVAYLQLVRFVIDHTCLHGRHVKTLAVIGRGHLFLSLRQLGEGCKPPGPGLSLGVRAELGF